VVSSQLLPSASCLLRQFWATQCDNSPSAIAATQSCTSIGLVNTTTTPTAISPVPISLIILLTNQRLLLSSIDNKKIGKNYRKVGKTKKPLSHNDFRGFL
jgi:hypothetical protein